MSGQEIAPVHDPVLVKSPLFGDLSELELNAVTAFLEPKKLSTGEVIFKEGEAGEEMYILISGSISAVVGHPDGSRHQMFEIKPGDFFGEMSVIANETRSATLTARTDCELLVFNGIDFYRIIYDHSIIGAKMLKAIRRVQNSWLEQTSKHLNELMRWGETARRRAVSDDVTNLYNRRFLEETASNRFAQGAVGPRNISLMMMDLDRFHEINNKYGPRVGDLVFIAVAEILRSSTRTEDICARLSGDEFAVLLPDAGAEEARIIAERICHTMASRIIQVPVGPDKPEKIGISISTSVGIASAPVHTDNWQDLFLMADRALSRAKELGRNRVEVAEGEKHED